MSDHGKSVARSFAQFADWLHDLVNRVSVAISNAPPLYIYTPAFSSRSGGVRCMHLLCHHLRRLGYEAYIRETGMSVEQSGLDTPRLDEGVIAKHRAHESVPIAIYPEVTKGNPLQARFVVRYLLNWPGLLNPGVEETYGPRDYFLHYAPEHVPEGIQSIRLFIPIVDRQIYQPPSPGHDRDGFVIYSHRFPPDPETFPPWVKPYTILSMSEPLEPAEMADLYRRSRAMVTLERGTAVLEALHCGCPVVCIPHKGFTEIPFKDVFFGCGLVWNWHEEMLSAAADDTAKFRAIYDRLEGSFDTRLRSAMNRIIRDVRHRQRSAGK